MVVALVRASLCLALVLAACGTMPLPLPGPPVDNLPGDAGAADSGTTADSGSIADSGSTTPDSGSPTDAGFNPFTEPPQLGSDVVAPASQQRTASSASSSAVRGRCGVISRVVSAPQIAAVMMAGLLTGPV